MEIYLREFCSPRSLDASRDSLHSACLHYAEEQIRLQEEENAAARNLLKCTPMANVVVLRPRVHFG